MARPTEIRLDINHEFSRLIVERGLNEYGEPAIKIRWGGSSSPVVVISMAEGQSLAAAINKLTGAA